MMASAASQTTINVTDEREIPNEALPHL